MLFRQSLYIKKKNTSLKYEEIRRVVSRKGEFFMDKLIIGGVEIKIDFLLEVVNILQMK